MYILAKTFAILNVLIFVGGLYVPTEDDERLEQWANLWLINNFLLSLFVMLLRR